MSKITKERLASVIISFFTVKTGMYSYYRLAKKTGLDSQTLSAWEREERSSIREEAFQYLIKGLDQDLKSSFKAFSEYAIQVLKEDGNNEEYLQDTFDPSSPIPRIVDTLLQGETDSKRHLQEKLGTEGITRILKDLLSQHHDYFQVAERPLHVMDNPIVYFSRIDLLNMSINNESDSQEPNYVVIKFPSAYNCLIILSNDHINYQDNEKFDFFAYRTEKLKAHNKIKIVLIITDIDENEIPFEKQSFLMERCKEFFILCSFTRYDLLSLWHQLLIPGLAFLFSMTDRCFRLYGLFSLRLKAILQLVHTMHNKIIRGDLILSRRHVYAA